MISIKQQDSHLIGDLEAISALSQKVNARVLVISDSHGNSNIMHTIIKKYGSDCDALVFCGDGMNDLMLNLEEAAIDLTLKKCFPPVVAFAAGNCDSFAGAGSVQTVPLYADNKVMQIKIPYSQTLKIGSHKFYITHGNREGVNYDCEGLQEKCRELDCDIGLYGHTHVAHQIIDDKLYVANPGSCSRPRGGQKPGFAIVTVQPNLVDIAFIQILNSYSAEPDFKIYTPIL